MEQTVGTVTMVACARSVRFSLAITIGETPLHSSANCSLTASSGGMDLMRDGVATRVDG